MPWWGWILEIIGLAVLAASIVFAVLGTMKKKPIAPLSLLIYAIAAVVAAILFVSLGPARPPAYLVVLSILAGIAAGAALSIPAQLKVEGRQIASSHGYLHIAIWSFLLMISSILVISGTGAAKVSVAIMLFASLGVAAYCAAIYLRYRTGVQGVAQPAGASGI